ncbi:MAG TPA: serine/threonine-protein kinase [Polyangiaceae bacterium LLY-WYZ-15_(1-7)]|nr:serine/threonine protein kinase [Myxococcales bacterium]MAT24547.1 serine/threonine protein kinase [Sandaracinus sp.]HJK94060.1 serine/threonine-protein kinase [Polyangiaceae bacterium LLY-WYZ-15_(1-7)]MBJ71465.1 serine/threonine protein kinase [Sandaracinus sp.]HJL03620.1 serine/threonine-protein kinase [Polyangiaceae bacterium LLY-WYZ-15_(1-7)]
MAPSPSPNVAPLPTTRSGSSSELRLRAARSGELVDGRYRLGRPIGRGGMGSIYEAEDEATGRTVAVKLLRHAEDRARFLREAAMTAAVRHPHVVRTLDYGGLEGAARGAYLVLERLRGETLRERLDGLGTFALPTCLTLLEQLLEALAAVHAAGIVHRDVKPANLFVTEGPPCALKLLDFGLGKALDETEALTAEGVIVGTPGYLAPEQVRADPIDPRTDLHGFAVTAYELLTGLRPFRREGASQTYAAVLFHEPTPPSALRPAIPPAVDALLVRCLAKTPTERPESVAEVLAAWPPSRD